MQISENERKLQEIYKKKVENGLVHVSFTTKNPVTLENREEIIEDLLAFEKAITEHKVKLLNFEDLRLKEVL